ncbi:MAG TPA: RNase adaptor protein RapZ, partial [Candidatus Tenderia electrophaga]|nr:RNase adaptor protein RapZ [Candidatus Tenderia electrophaga]
RFLADSRAYMTVAIGCTGGQHRSVYLSQRMAKHFHKADIDVLLRHRELA